MCLGLTGNAHSHYCMSATDHVDDFSGEVSLTAEYFAEKTTLLNDIIIDGFAELVVSVAARFPEKSWLISVVGGQKKNRRVQ